ncbi:ankyrin repeat-containing domain protein [Trichoderma sp. SZMC 28012]
MSVSSGPPSSSGSEYTYHRPSHRKDFQIAIICALSLEYDAATLIVDEFWDQDGKQYGRTSGDTNIYRNGRIGIHNVVLMLLPNMGKAAVAGSAASLRTSYSNLRIAFLVGVCGGVPIVGAHEALLGDVAIGEAIIQYDFGRQYPGEFIPKETAVATQSLPNKDIRTLLAYFKSDTGKADLRQNTARHLRALQGVAVQKEYQYNYRYPGFAEDKLFVATYRHKHRGGPSGDPCCETESYCDNAAQSSCSELGCDEKMLVQRHRLERKRDLPWEEAQCPDIFIGRVASADTVMKSGDHRDQIAKQYDIIAFEMEGAGLWDECPCIVIKGICDYADSHKNKIWQPFAAATAAAAVKAMLARYAISDQGHLSRSSTREIEDNIYSNDHTTMALDSTQHGQIVPARYEITHRSAQKTSSTSILGTTKSNGTQTLRDSIFDFQRALTDDQQRELQGIKTVPDAIAVLVFTAELDSLNRNRKGRSIASRLHSVLQSVRDFSAAVEAIDSTHLGIASILWGSVKLTMLVTVKSVTYDEALSTFFMDLGGLCPRWKDYQIFYSSSPRLQDALYDFYASLIRCCKRAVETAQNTWSGYLFSSPRESLEGGFQQDADDIERRSKYVKDALSLAKTEARYQNQQLQSLRGGLGSKKMKRPRAFRGKGEQHDRMESWQAQSDERQAKERKQRLLDSLSTHDYLTPFKQSCRKRYSGTLEWLFHTDEFNMWNNSREFPLLWCSGKIGSGKTTLTASVIEKLLTEKRSPDVFIGFFFIRFDDRQSLNAEVILKSIVRQMLNVSTIYERVEAQLNNMQLDLASGLIEIAKLLQGIAAKFKKLYIVIDGLDECTKSERHDLLETLHSVLKARPNTKLFLAGRDSVSREVQLKFPTLIQIPMDCSSAQSDIATYVEGIVQEKLKTEELIVGDPDLIEDIKAALSDGANGMFLWVVFQVNELCLQHCDEDIRTAIQNFPKDLEETFNRAIDRIVSRGNQDIAKRVFRWVAAAKEPLSLDQLEEIIFVEIGQEYSKTERQSNGIAHISSWCENLVHVDEELKTVQFVHQTVQQFFIERSSESRHNQFYLNLEDADHYIGEICVTYLNFNDFKTTLARRQRPLPPMPPIAMAGTALRPQWKAVLSIPVLLKLNLDTRGGSTASNAIEALGTFQRDDTGSAKEGLHVGHPFLEYASIHWISHTAMFQKEKSKTWNLWEKMIVQGHELVKKPWIEGPFEKSIGTILDWGQNFHHYALIRLLLLRDMLSIPDRGRAMQNAANREDIMLLDILLERPEGGLLIIRQGCEVAVKRGRLNALKRLLDAGADGQTALDGAAISGHQNIIMHLLSAGVDGRTALNTAARNRDVSAVKSLLDAGVDGLQLLQDLIDEALFDVVDQEGARTVLDPTSDHYAIKVLVAAGVDGQPILQTAIQGSSRFTIALLLAAGVNGQSALLAACKAGEPSNIKLLLAAGVDSQDALQTAARRGHQDIVKSLLAAGASSRVVLLRAVDNGDLDTIKSLLAAGVDGQEVLQTAIKSRDLHAIDSLLTAGVDGQTPLQTAVKSGNGDVIKCLLALGVDSQPALQAAAENDDIHTIKLLLANGVDSQAAMFTAAKQGSSAVIENLLTAGVDISALTTRTPTGQSVLQIAAQWGHIKIIESLLASGSTSFVGSTWHTQYALFAASRWGHLDIVERMLDVGATVDDESRWGTQSALQAASEGGHLDIVEKLLAAGSQVNAYHTWGGRSALEAASGMGHLDVVERLLAAGAKVNTYDTPENPTALQAACQGGHLDVVKRLLAAGAEVDENGMSGNALEAASEGGHLDVVETLLAAGFEVNTRKNRWRGRIALQAASRGGHLRVVERLLAAGADVNAAAGSKAQTALQLATKGGHTKIVSRLKQAGAKK